MLVRTVGGSHQPIVTALQNGRPEYVVFVCSGKDPATGRPGAGSLYKLDSLTALGGLTTRGMLASYQPLERWDRQRAEDLRIRVVEAGQLRNLDRHLGEWVTAS